MSTANLQSSLPDNMPASPLLQMDHTQGIRGRSQAIAWMTLGVATLGASTLFAILVAASRSPATAKLLPGNDFFHVALILHVTLGPVLFFLAFAMALWNLALPETTATRSGWVWDALGWSGFALAVLGSGVLILVPAGSLFGISPGEHVLSNYIPVLRSPIFLAGLALFGSGFLLALIRILHRLRPTRLTLQEQPLGWGLLAAALAGIVVLVSIARGATALSDSMAPAAFYEMLFWGPGHTLQSMHVLMMMVAWLVLADAAKIPLRSSATTQRLLFFMATLPVLAAPLIYLVYTPESTEFRNAFTTLMRWAIWPALALLALDIIYGFVQRGRGNERWTPATWALMLSILLLIIGLVIGLSIHENNAVVPAHYHATTGAITMAYLGIALLFLTRITGTVSMTRWPVLAYGSGTLMMALALGWAGFSGLTRKVPGSEKALEGFSMHLTFIAMGGTLVIIGGIGFVAVMLRSWLRKTSLPKWKMALLLLSASTIMLLGLVFTLLPASGVPNNQGSALIDPLSNPEGHMQQAQTAEVTERFQQGVMMLHAKRFDLALAPFNRVLTLEPRLPEAYVNLGFALLGLQRYEAARNSFESAIEIRPMQANAYYGLAVTMHEMKDAEGAIGTMRSYIHLSKPDDRYLNNARTLLAEWEKERGHRPGNDLPAVTAKPPK